MLDAEVVFLVFEPVGSAVPTVEALDVTVAGVEYDEGDERPEKRLVSSESKLHLYWNRTYKDQIQP